MIKPFRLNRGQISNLIEAIERNPLSQEQRDGINRRLLVTLKAKYPQISNYEDKEILDAYEAWIDQYEGPNTYADEAQFLLFINEPEE